MYPNINFNFNEIDMKNSKYDSDIVIAIVCIILCVLTFFLVLIPEKNVEITGNDLNKFTSTLNPKWLDDSLVKAYSLETRLKKANNLMGKENIKDKMQFLMLVTSIAGDQKKIKRSYVEQIIIDRKIILAYLMQEFKNSKKTEFSCILAACKDKEYKVKQQKLQIIKFVNLQLESYYNTLKHINSMNKPNVYGNISMNIEQALTNKEQKQYEEMYSENL